MQVISKYHKKVQFLLCLVDTYSKYAWVVWLKDEKCIIIISAFQKVYIIPNKILVGQGNVPYNKSMSPGCTLKILEFIQHTMKENLFLRK